MTDISLIDVCQTHLPVQNASNIELIHQKCCDLQQATSAAHMQNKPLVCSIACPVHTGCSAFPFYTPSILHSNKTVVTVKY